MSNITIQQIKDEGQKIIEIRPGVKLVISWCPSFSTGAPGISAEALLDPEVLSPEKDGYSALNSIAWNHFASGKNAEIDIEQCKKEIEESIKEKAKYLERANKYFTRLNKQGYK